MKSSFVVTVEGCALELDKLLSSYLLIKKKNPSLCKVLSHCTFSLLSLNALASCDGCSLHLIMTNGKTAFPKKKHKKKRCQKFHPSLMLSVQRRSITGPFFENQPQENARRCHSFLLKLQFASCRGIEMEEGLQ